MNFSNLGERHHAYYFQAIEELEGQWAEPLKPPMLINRLNPTHPNAADPENLESVFDEIH
jgi:hypothetical protein